jgi:hypothetical protein
MRRTPLVIALLVLVVGCVDGLGLRSSCSADMRAVSLTNGGPPPETQSDEDRGDFIEEWYYYHESGRRKYTFRWGVSYERCQVTSSSFSRSPLPD